jgi:hypothetical protein
MISKQETFDTVARGLILQGKSSVVAHGFMTRCLFRGPGGTKCAVGFLIPDHLYDIAMDGHGGAGLGTRIAASLGHDENFCCELMFIHDKAEPAQWELELYRLAARYKLVATAVAAAVEEVKTNGHAILEKKPNGHEKTSIAKVAGIWVDEALPTDDTFMKVMAASNQSGKTTVTLEHFKNTMDMMKKKFPKFPPDDWSKYAEQPDYHKMYFGEWVTYAPPKHSLLVG